MVVPLRLRIQTTRIDHNVRRFLLTNNSELDPIYSARHTKIYKKLGAHISRVNRGKVSRLRVGTAGIGCERSWRLQ